MPGTQRTASGVLGGLLGVLGLSTVAGVLITATITPALAVTGTAASTAISIFDDLPANLQIDELMLPTIFYAKNPDTGKYQEMTRFYEQNRSPVAFDQIAPVMIDAITSSEDGHFFEHGGVDLVGTVSALMRNATTDSTSGGSTISQQYVKNIQIQACEADATTEEDRLACFDKVAGQEGNDAIARKIQEMRYSISLEQKYSKETILLGYLNIANFGGVTYGIDAAARYNFGIPASQLNLSQSATLAGMLNNPNTLRLDREDNADNNAENGYAMTKDRQLTVLYNMRKDGKITEEQYQAAVEAPIEPKITPQKHGCAAATGMEYFCQMVKGVMLQDPAFGETIDERNMKLNRGGLKVYTTIDTRLQKIATDAMKGNVPATYGYGSLGSSIINIETTTGRVLTTAQNTIFSEVAADEEKPGYTSLVYAADKRFGPSMGGGFPAGSTFKLFTLLDWLEKGHSVNERLDGRNRSTFQISCDGNLVNTGEQVREVGNFGRDPGWGGTPMSFTASSLNTGFFAMAEKLNICDIGKVATKLGVVKGDTLEPPKMDGAFSILGSNNISPMAIGGAYATVANGGTYCQPKVIDSITNAQGEPQPDLLPQTTCTRQLTPEVAGTAAYALEGVMSGGTGSGANPWDGTPLIGKTGTHQDWQTWMVESSATVTTVAWVGNANGDIIPVTDDWTSNSWRYELARPVQAYADLWYPAGDFLPPSTDLTRRVYVDVPNVVGMTIADATATLQSAGLTVSVGPEVDGPEAQGIITAQNPGPGRVEASSVTISPSNGQGGKVPNVVGMTLSEAQAALSAAGFTDIATQCKAKGSASPDGEVTDTNPNAGASVKKNTKITVKYERNSCS